MHRGSWSDLADAALALLGNSALDEAAEPPQQQQQQQQHWQVRDCLVVHSRQCNKHSPSARGNWEAFVQECLGSKTTAVAAAELLGHGQQLAQQGDQQVGQQVGQDGGQRVVYGQQQDADASSSLNCPFNCQVRLKLKSNQSSHSLCTQGLCRGKCLQLPVYC